MDIEGSDDVDGRLGVEVEGSLTDVEGFDEVDGSLEPDSEGLLADAEGMDEVEGLTGGGVTDARSFA